ncbi:hypothetical protein RFI_05655 [Reticulomyxa filosa]|uniref:Uncharacterized protein n=1 Tax=Reticulomyxa filosa TaxID=46433 RepID=X6NYT6_RETFI|nr:hypothetical protein RFI_05655 [Reticulomyxa filosa]|eukprot:ETO31465.1 hypothetical protein RFI_05655 [Reticulomyxa filosa]
MRDEAVKLYQLTTNKEELGKARFGLYAALKDIHKYEYKEDIHPDTAKKNNLIDFANLNFEAMDLSDQTVLNNLFGLSSNNFSRENIIFSEISQFDAKEPNVYRTKMFGGEVKMIPPFDHLHRQFKPSDSCLHPKFQEEEEDDDDDDNDTHSHLSSKRVHSDEAPAQHCITNEDNPIDRNDHKDNFNSEVSSTQNGAMSAQLTCSVNDQIDGNALHPSSKDQSSLDTLRDKANVGINQNFATLSKN